MRDGGQQDDIDTTDVVIAIAYASFLIGMIVWIA